MAVYTASAIRCLISNHNKAVYTASLLASKPLKELLIAYERGCIDTLIMYYELLIAYRWDLLVLGI